MYNYQYYFTICAFVLALSSFSATGEPPKPPFGSGRSPTTVSAIAWEQLITDPKSYVAKVVSISGCIEVLIVDGRASMRIYKDRESYLYNRPKTFIELDDSNQFIAALGNKDMDKWRLLDGKEVECWGTWQEHSLNDMSQNVGSLRAPYLIRVVGKQGEIFIEDRNAKWK